MRQKICNYFGDNDAFQRNKVQAMKRNAKVLEFSLVIAVILFSIAFISCFVFDSYAYLKSVYPILIALCGILFLLVHYAKIRFSMLQVYLVFGILITYATVTSAFISPNFVCVTILAFLFQFPVLYLDKGWRIDLATGTAAAVYLLVVCQNKTSLLVEDEIVNVVIFAVLGCAVGSFIRRTQLESFDNQENLRISEEQYRLALTHSDNMICRYDLANHSMSASKETAAFFMQPEIVKDVPYGTVQWDSILPESREEYLQFFEDILQGNQRGTATFCMMTIKGWRWLRGDYTTIFSASGRPMYAVISFRDITEQREKEMVYRKWKQEIASMPREKTALFEWNLTRDVSERQEGGMIEYFKNLPVGTFNGRTQIYVKNNVYIGDQQEYLTFLNRERLLGAYREGLHSGGMDYRVQMKDGSCKWMNAAIQLVPYPDSDEVKAFLIIRDIDHEKKLTLDMTARAREDAVTHLLNRAAFRDEVMSLLDSEKRGSHAFVMIDIDKFKTVNDTLGHLAGDKCLAEFADRLRSILRQEDLVGRLGGDEFAVCLKNIGSHQLVVKKAAILCRVLHKTMEEGPEISASLGVALFPSDGATFEELYRKADLALYEAKKRGKNRFVFYEENMGDPEFISNATPIETVVPEEEDGRE